MKRLAFEIEVPDDSQIDASTIIFALHGIVEPTRVTMLSEPSPQTYHPERRWLTPSP